MGFQISFLDRWLKFSSFILFLFIFACTIPVFATHTATVTVSPQYVLGGSTDIYTFTITNNPDSSNFIYYLKISAPSGFTIDSDVSCPSGWGVNIAADGSYVECSGDPDPNENKKIDIGESETISFKAISSPTENTYQWTVLTKDNAFHKEYNYPTTTVDNTKPTVTSVSSDGAIYNTRTQSPVTITVIFSEDISNTPIITVDSESQTVNDCGDNDAKTFCFNYAIPASTQATKTITISGAKDLAGNEMEEDSTHTFRVDTKLPSISSLSISPTTINESSVGIAKFTITIQYSEEMDTSITPTITFTPPIDTTLTNCKGSWSDSYSYMYTCDIEDNDVEQPNINVTVSGAKDLAGNEQEDYTLTNVIRVDTKAPVDPTNVYVEAGPNNEANVINIYNKNSVNVAVVFSSPPEAGTVIVELSDGTNTITSTAPANTEGTITIVTNIDAASLNDGAITVKAKIVDNAGNENPSGFVTGTAATKDTQVPTVFTLTVSPTIVNEASVGIDKFTITIDYSEEMDTSTNPTITFNPPVDTTLSNCEGSWLDSDTYTFTCNVEDVNVEQSGIDVTISGAKDLTGNEQEVYIKEDAFDVDTLAPEFTNIFPPSNSYINASSSIQYTLNDDIISGEINFIDSSNNVLTYTLGDSYLAPGTHTIPLSSLGLTLTDGETYNISFYGIDAAGNEVTITNTNITYDETPPITVEIINPSDGAYVKGIVTIKVNAVDNEIGSGIAKVEFYLNETILGIDENPTDGWSYDWDTTEVTDGNYSLTAKAIDKAGNSKTSASISVTVDNTPPQIIKYTIENPIFSPNGDGIKDNVTIDLAFSEYVEADVNILDFDDNIIKELYHSDCVKNPKPKPWDGKYENGTSVSDGVYTIRVVITDLAGNSVTDTNKTVIVDTKAPIVTVNPLITNDTSPQLTGTVDDATAIVNVTVNGTTYTATVSTTTNSYGIYDWTADVTDPLGDGTYEVSVTAIDQAGNVGNNATQLIIDTTPPAISEITYPSDGDYVKGTITIEANATDNEGGSGIAKVEFYLNDTLLGIDENSTDGWSYDWNTTEVDDGSYYLTVVAIDRVGNSLSSSPISVRVDNTPPTIEITSPTQANPAYKQKGQTVSVSYNYTEQNPESIIIKIKKEDTVIGTKTIDNGLESGKVSRTDNVTLDNNAIDGTYDIEITINDEAGNTATDTEIGAVVVDSTPPTTSEITNPPNGTYVRGTVTIEANAEDNANGSGIAKVEFYYENTKIGENADSPYSIDWDTTTVEDGTYSLIAVAVDRAGNSLTSSPVSVTVDNTPPQIIERNPGINAVGVDPATNITVKFSENVTCSLGSWENCISVSSEEGNVSGDVTYQDRTLIFNPKDPLKSNTEFTVNLTGITDLAGNSLEGITGWSFVTATYYSIELTPGWNLISIPVVPENTSIEVVLGDAEGKIEGIWTYDAVNEEWYVYHPNNSTTSNLDTMIPGYGYWIKAKENATIKGYGSLFREREVPPQRILVPGWNLIGYYQKPGEEEAPVYCALSSLLKYYCVGDCCNVPISERYWTSLVTYDNHRKVFEEIGPDDIMEPGKGYWIFMRSSEIDNYLYGPGETCE